jgi:hypothetical protein
MRGGEGWVGRGPGRGGNEGWGGVGRREEHDLDPVACIGSNYSR